ncbi:MAG: hypothetical protein ACE5D6_06215 [Candidatus Zixiibacteriota bacterium]
MYHKCILLIIYLSCIIISCNSSISDGGGFTKINGIVIDSTTKVPLDLVNLFLDDTTIVLPNDSIVIEPLLTTDSSGTYSLSFQGGGTFNIYALKEGYYSKLQTVTTTSPNQIFNNIDFELVKK